MNTQAVMIDAEVRAMLQKSIQDWCQAHQAWLNALESPTRKAGDSGDLFRQLNHLGVLHILFDQGEATGMALVAEAAFEFARCSPSLAVMVVQQNMASELLAEAGKPEPTGWVALPLFDAPMEWPFQLTTQWRNNQLQLDGRWQGIPLLPDADTVLLPVCEPRKHEFRLVEVGLKPLSDEGLSTQHAGIMLGLRGCVMGDLEVSRYAPEAARTVLQGAEAQAHIACLWSQAEVCMMAIRSAIHESTYHTARDYAKTRWQGGQYIIEHSLVRKMLADLYQEHCALYENWQSMAATLKTASPLRDGQIAQAINSGERLPWACSDGIQLLGGNGYMEDYPQARCFRDAKQCEFLLGHPQAKRFELWQKEYSL